MSDAGESFRPCRGRDGSHDRRDHGEIGRLSAALATAQAEVADLRTKYLSAAEVHLRSTGELRAEPEATP